MYCTECGTLNSKENQFCTNCGTKLISLTKKKRVNISPILGIGIIVILTTVIIIGLFSHNNSQAPENVVKEYYKTLETKNFEKLNQLLHPESRQSELKHMTDNIIDPLQAGFGVQFRINSIKSSLETSPSYTGEKVEYYIVLVNVLYEYIDPDGNLDEAINYQDRFVLTKKDNKWLIRSISSQQLGGDR